jgi:coenzyme F420-dependent glucose-6-phosphate dehydrogenase
MNASIGFHASHEQFSPVELLNLVQQAELCGFESVMSSDHLNPWSEQQGHSGFSWSWLGAALQATSHIPFGTIAVPGGWRYHPVIVAQAAATLSQMYPARMNWIAVGSGEALNESVVSPEWPHKDERNARMKEGVDIIRALWDGKTVTQTDGYHYTKNARIWSLPPSPPKILGAALSPETASFIGNWADGMITVMQPDEKLKGIIAAFREHGGEGKQLYLQLHISWHQDEEQAKQNAFDQWRNNLIAAEHSEDLSTIDAINKAAKSFTTKDLEGKVITSSDYNLYIQLIRKYIGMGFNTVILHNTGRNQSEFIKAFGSNVLPYVKNK